MRHELRPEGRAFRLRPIGLGDAGFVVALRSDPRALGRLHPISAEVDDQVLWLERYFVRPGDWYWIVERRTDDTPEGTIGLYDLDPARGLAEWGRWILRPGSLAAAESALLLYRIAFERMGLDEVHCRTVATNSAVISFHDRSGLARIGTVAGAFRFGETAIDAVEHRLGKEDWPTTRGILESRAAQAALLVEREAGA
jgi:RimJ/RimL family protein N-acetyltransferase